jgi:hypothetical protein|tara:strand:- start:523 stop:732 length:210 start_codon:yes stop_codon:yes gene_type:complete
MATTKANVVTARRLLKRAIHSLDQAKLTGDKSDRDAAGSLAADAAKTLGHKAPAKKAPPKKAPAKKASK